MALTKDQQVGLAFLAYLIIPIILLLLVWLWMGIRRLFGGKTGGDKADGET